MVLILSVMVGAYMLFPQPVVQAGTLAASQESSEGTEFEEVRPRKVTIDLDPFDLDVRRGALGSDLSSERPLSGDLRMEISEKEVSRLANLSAEDASVEAVNLERDQVTVESSTRLLGFGVPVTVRGDLEVRDQELVFEPSRASAFGVRLPDRLADELVSRSNFSYPLDDLPYGANISGIEVKEDYLVMRGRLERIPLGEMGGR